jgi:predicted metal-dependent phosphoesterase TrpH
VIDLHLHTTASDGLLAPDVLVARAAAAGLTAISITDHDTTAGLGAGAAAAKRLGMEFVTGIEITAVERDRDVHILGYFIDPVSKALDGFLREQRADRIRRVKEIGERLASLGYHVDVDTVLASARRGRRTVGRPALADALVGAGHAADRTDAFARLLGRDCPAYVPRRGLSGSGVIDVIHRAGGLASLAHPGVLGDDALVPGLVAAGLDALEVWHCDHLPRQVEHYGRMASRHGLARTGGSDFHGDGVHRACHLGGVTVPPEALTALAGRAGRAR